MDVNARPRRDPHCVEEILEGEIVLYGAGATQAFYLNETASLVWMLINGERTVGDITALLCEAYPEATTAREDVAGVMAQLLRHGVVRL